MKSKLTIAGLLIGSVVGFLLRPSVPLMGQLPFTTVVTRGDNLRGLDQLLLGYARTSFNYLIAGRVIGTIIGLIAAFVIPSRKS
jgi:small basic protein